MPSLFGIGVNGRGGDVLKEAGVKKKIIEIHYLCKLSLTLLQYTEFLARKTHTIQITAF